MRRAERQMCYNYGMKILVIVPCFNEAENILKTVEDLEGGGYDYIVINDGSTDNSLEVLQKNHIQHLDLANNIGIGGVMQTGYKYALRAGYDIAVQFDGDGQHDASYIPAIVKDIANKKADMVIGSRFIKKDASDFQSTKMRRLGIKLLSWLLMIMSGKRILDMTSGFRAVNKKVIERFANEYPAEYPEPVTNLDLVRNGFRVKEVPVRMKERQHGKSSITTLKSIYYMLNVILLFFLVLIKQEKNDATKS